jgi:nucleotide-binding universal stress UspA family protein
MSRNRFRSIIVPVDGSELAEGAIPFALAIAERAHAKIRFVLVHPQQFPPLLIEPAKVYLKALTRRYKEQLGRSVSSIILHGPVARTLTRYARDIGADLIVMTSHGRGGVRRAWLGSVADQLIRATELPVLVVRPSEDGQVPDIYVGEILVPLDGSPLSEAAIEPAAALAKLWEAEIALLQVVPPVAVNSDPAMPFPAMYDDELTGIRRDTAEDYLRGLSERLRNQGTRASGTTVVSQTGLAQTILDLARPERVSLIAMATHGRGGLRRLVLGSVTDKVVRAAPMSVLVVPPRRPAAKERQAKPQRVRALTVGEEFAFA